MECLMREPSMRPGCVEIQVRIAQGLRAALQAADSRTALGPIPVPRIHVMGLEPPEPPEEWVDDLEPGVMVDDWVDDIDEILVDTTPSAAQDLPTSARAPQSAIELYNSLKYKWDR